MTRTLVTGAGGFVGTALCNVLRSRGLPFVAAVRQANDNGQVSVGDLSGCTDWAAALSGCDAVIHLAARVHVMTDRSDDPQHAYREVNVNATVNLAKQAVAHGVKRFVFVSSVKVNGEATTDNPFRSCDIPGPVDYYGQSKLEAEMALQEISVNTGLEVVIVRPPLVYGPGVRANFHRLMQLVKLGFPLPLGGIDNRRSMVAVDNLVDLLILCVNHPGAGGRTFLVSDGVDFSTTELVSALARSMGQRLLAFPAPVGAIKMAAKLLGKENVTQRLLASLQVNIEDTKEILDWEPVLSPEEAIEKTVIHFLTTS